MLSSIKKTSGICIFGYAIPSVVGSVILPVRAAATAVSGLTRYAWSPTVPVLPAKFLLKVRKDTTSLAGEKPWPMHGPQLDSRMRAPAEIISARAPFWANIDSTSRLPGATANSTILLIFRPLRVSATIIRSV